MKTVEDLQVSLGERSYPIAFTGADAGLLARRLEQVTVGYSKVAIVVDKALADCIPILDTKNLQEKLVKKVFTKQGETLKSFEYLGGLLDWFAETNLDRKGCVIAIGGGVLGDLVGFSAAVWLRGVDFIQMPTTLLAMVDSSVGGKTGINISAGKNLVGAFYQPKAVFIHTDFLKTLPSREFSAGMAEVIKYGALGDSVLFEQLETMDVLHAEHPRLAEVIRRCCEIKSAIVGDDERELSATGGRALLNLGHTFGHAIENVAGYGEYLHGEAVGVGLVLAAQLSLNLGYISQEEVNRVSRLCEKYRLPVRLSQPLSIDRLMMAMLKDKKTAYGKLRFIVMKKIGIAAIAESVSEELIRKLWRDAGGD